MRAALVCCAAVFAGTVAADEPASVWAEAAQAYDLDPIALYAIALQESRMMRPDGAARPWPWTLRSSRDGPQRFETLPEARAALENLVAAGERNVDVGLMQVNLGVHGFRTERPTDLLDPQRNVLVGAAILRDALRANNGELALALGAYHHGPHTERGRRYSEEVRRRLDRLQALPGIARALSGEAQ